ncbi:hypothetical protein LZ575_03820 [Antarcticibacterium sp. 1MA-6-2]|uniref:hypothetical protein n=1 Tax=Antarcticibacterium sp. 1MA-6-2 TaxID=2908210 RepID=UPI001F2F2FF7|nr:hypothetical protein [Antarcticibacterium sp. 1MA-6-2]UJH91804.1 hypothetical protein LZ575_03820 [Antarcticibacterium sp. 1MA-6-2]
MKKKYLLAGIFFFLLLYPSIQAYLVMQSLELGQVVNRVERSILFYQISIWLSWIVFMIIAVYYKWTTENNFFFILTYAFLLLTFSFFGYFVQAMVNFFELPSTFEDNYTLGVFTALENFAIAALLTAFLHAAVWWFTRRWHRR